MVDMSPCGVQRATGRVNDDAVAKKTAAKNDAARWEAAAVRGRRPTTYIAEYKDGWVARDPKLLDHIFVLSQRAIDLKQWTSPERRAGSKREECRCQWAW